MSISATQLNRFRDKASKLIEQVFPTTIVVGELEIDCARWSATSSASAELAGLFAGCDIVFRIQRENIPDGVTFTAEKTKLTEDDKAFRVEQVRDAKTDTAILVGCKAA